MDSHYGGSSVGVRLQRLVWGRMVDVYDVDELGERRLQHEDYVIGGEVISNGVDILLETSPVTRRESLTIRHTAGAEDSRYAEFFASLDRNLQPVSDENGDQVGLFTMVPRNAVLVAHFDDLIDPETMGVDSVQVRTGSPPVQPFEGRILVDYNHGDLVSGPGGPVFRSTRIIIDPTVSDLESFTADPPLPINGIGLPPAVDVNRSNLALRLPTEISTGIGTDVVLRNLSGHVLATSANGTVDFASPTVDVVRFMRSGGRTEVTGDPNNGFLRDQDPPLIVGRQSLQILDSPVPDSSSDDPARLILPRIEFLSLNCSQVPQAGDVLQQAGIYAEVIDAASGDDATLYEDVRVRLLFGTPDEWVDSALGVAQFLSTFDPLEDEGKEACFLSVLPSSSGYPEAPLEGLATDSVISLRFSEPMDPDSITAFDSLTVTRISEPLKSTDFVVGRVALTLDLAEFGFSPDLPLAHQNGQSETYYLNLSPGDDGPTDLAGNPVAAAMPQLSFSIDADQASQRNSGRVSRFSSADEDPPFGDQGGPMPEWTGQHLYDLTRGIIRPRPVIRYQGIADVRSPIVSLLTPFAPGVQTPLSRLGSKLQTVWRYADFGFALTAYTNANIDIEGLNWSSGGGQVVADFYPEFEIRLSHSFYLPDEFVNGQTFLPQFPQSGLKRNFDDNQLSASDDPQRIVHPKHLGYTLNPDDSYSAGGGTILVPWPMNRDLPVSEHRYFTWRDTGLVNRAAPQGGGVDLRQLVNQFGIGVAGLMAANEVSTIGLGLLLEFRCYPDDAAVGLNPFKVRLGTLASPQPNFRAYSTGGLNQTGVVVRIDPDTETVANGGYNPRSNPPGAKTNAVDNTFYEGAIDVVTRVSRSVSIWFEAEGTSSPRYRPAVVEPLPNAQPIGTEVSLSFRGATVAEPAAVRENAIALDLYGDHHELPEEDRWHPNPEMILFEDGQWFDDIQAIDGAPYYQVRVTFLANTESALVAELSALAVAWEF